MKKLHNGRKDSTFSYSLDIPMTSSFGVVLLSITLMLMAGCAHKNTSTAEIDGASRKHSSLNEGASATTTEQARLEKAKEAKKFREANEERKRVDAAQEVIDTARSQLGTPYRYGGTSPSTGFDCSGFLVWSFSKHGIKLPRSSREQLHAGIPVDKDNLKPGDILIYSRRIGSRRSTHAGLYIGDGKFIHSPHAGSSVRIDNAFDNHYSKRFIAGRRVIMSADEVKVYAEQKRKHKEFLANGAEHKVKRGETLSGIAMKYGVTVRSILQANNISRKTLLQIGQKLHIPGAKSAPASVAANAEKKGQAVQADATPKVNARATAKASASSVPVAKGTRVHVVAAGDTVWSISKHYGVSKKDVLTANNLSARSLLQIGQKLQIPVGKAQAANKTAGNEATRTASAAAGQRVETRVYRVKKGDTIWSLARTHGVSTKALLEANGLNDKDVLKLGQELRVPVAAAN